MLCKPAKNCESSSLRMHSLFNGQNVSAGTWKSYNGNKSEWRLY